MLRIPALLILLLLLLFSACSIPVNSPQENSVGRSQVSKKISPSAGSNVIMSDTEYELQSSAEVQLTSSLALQLPSEYLLIEAKDYNLDMDEMDEQIVLHKLRDDDSDLIHVMILDYDFVRGSYAISWDAETNGTSSQSVKVSATDVTGDGNQEIVIFGIDNEGRQTLDLFAAVSQITGQGLQFRSVFNTAVDGTIELKSPERSEYDIGRSTTTPYSIIIQMQDKASENITDLIQETYIYQPSQRRYVLNRKENIPGAQQEESRLQQLYNSDAKAFESFLEGPWYRENPSSALDNETTIVSFFPESREIVFHGTENQQVFNWNVSTKTIFRNIRIDIRNQILPTISTFGSVAVLRTDTIQIRIQSHSEWNGEYHRLTPSLQLSMIEKNQNKAAPLENELAGLFQNEANQSLLFENNRFTYNLDDETFSGGFSVYTLNSNKILELQAVSRFGLPQERFLYNIEIQVSTNNEQTIRKMTLQPIMLNTHKIIPDDGEPIKLEQIIEHTDR